MKKLLVIIFTTTLLFAQAGNDRSAEFFSNWYDTILNLEDTTVTGASNQWIQDGRGNRTGISISDDGKTGFGTLEPDKLIGLSDGTDQFSISVYDDKFTIWNDAGVPLALFTIDSVGNIAVIGWIGFTQQTVIYNVTTTTVDWGKGNKASITATGNIGTFAFTNPPTVGNCLLEFIHSGGGRIVTTWDADILWVDGGTAPTLSTVSADVDILTFYWNGTNYYGIASLDFE